MRNVSLLAAAVAMTMGGAGLAEAGPFGNKNKIGWTSQIRVMKSSKVLGHKISNFANHVHGPAHHRAKKLGNNVKMLRNAIKTNRPSFAIRGRHQNILATYRDLLATPKNFKGPKAKKSFFELRQAINRLNYNMRARRLGKTAEHMSWRAEKFLQAVAHPHHGPASYLKQDAKLLKKDVKNFEQDAKFKTSFDIAFGSFKDLRAVYCGTEEQAHYSLANSFQPKAKHAARQLQESYRNLHRELFGFDVSITTGPFAGCGTLSFF